MPSLRQKLPEYVRYKNRFARVQIGGRTVHLGVFNSPESTEKYKRLIAEWVARDRTQAEPTQAGRILVADVVNRFAEHIRNLFKTKLGRDTGTAANYKPALKLLLEIYGGTPTEEFGPLAVKALRLAMVERGLSRRSVNDAAARIRRVFKFAAGEELISERVPLRLAQVEGQRRGETVAAEPRKVHPVDDAIVDKTLPHLPTVVADMVRLQRLTGARPGEVVQLRPIDINRKGEVWRYVPREHKTEGHGVERVICLGPQAQAVLLPYLLRAAEMECFSPREVWANQTWDGKRRRMPQIAYTNDTYRRAITRACEKAFAMPKELQRAPGLRVRAKQGKPPQESPEEKATRETAAAAWRARHCWHPHQLRHTAATEIRRKFGLEAAQVALGHTKANMTERYAEKNLHLADAVAREIG